MARPRSLPPWPGSRAAALALGLAAITPGTAQTVRYALPEPGEYRCLTPTLTPGARFDPITGRVQADSRVTFMPSPLGTLTLEPGGRYRLSVGNARGTYRATPDGAIAFAGPLGARAYTTTFSAKGGTFQITVTYRAGPREAAVTSWCTRASPRARMTVRGGPNPGLSGQIVFTREGRVYAADAASGRVSPLADGTLGFAARGGDLVYQNGAGQLIVVARDGAVVLRLDPEASNDGQDSFSLNFPTRREDLALSPDGTFVVYSADDVIKGYRVVVRTRAGKEVAVVPKHTSANFTPDGRLLLAGFPKAGGPSGVYLTDRAFGHARRLDPNLDFPNTPAMAPDLKRVAFVQGGKLWLVNADGTRAKTLPTRSAKFPNAEVHGWPAWSPDGKWIAVAAEVDGLRGNGDEILIVPANGDAAKLQWLGTETLDAVHTSGDRLSWR